MDKIKAIENIFLESLDKLDSKDKLRNNKDILFKLFSENNVFFISSWIARDRH